MATKTLCNGATCFCVTWHIVPSGAQATTEEKEVAADGGEGGCVELISCLSPTQTCLFTSERCLKVRVEQPQASPVKRRPSISRPQSSLEMLQKRNRSTTRRLCSPSPSPPPTPTSRPFSHSGHCERTGPAGPAGARPIAGPDIRTGPPPPSPH